MIGADTFPVAPFRNSRYVFGLEIKYSNHIKIYRIETQVLTGKPVHIALLTDSFI